MAERFALNEFHDDERHSLMEFVEGKTLRHVIDEEGPLKVERFVDIALQIADGLAAVHEKNILHRDIKSENILLTPRGQAKITDCGLAIFRDSKGMTETGTMVGTIAYMSPEQLRGEPLDNRSDVYSLGVMLYEMLSGKLPFRGEHPAALMYSIVYEEPPAIKGTPSVPSNVPLELERIIKKALEKQQDLRYQQVGELRSDLAS